MRLTIEQMETFVRAVNTDHDSWKHDEKIVYHIDSDRVVAAWTKLMSEGTGVAYGVIREGQPAGFLLGIYTDDLLTGERTGYEYLFMVHRAHRFGNVALGLLQEFEDGAREAGCKKTVIGCHAAFKPESLARLYKRLGYSLMSQSFEKPN